MDSLLLTEKSWLLILKVLNILPKKSLKAILPFGMSPTKKLLLESLSIFFILVTFKLRFFDHILEVQPNIIVTYNGDFFDW